MSWQAELCDLYDRFYGTEAVGESLLPISHSAVKAQIQITVDEEGNFVEASRVEKEDDRTIIPVTEDSGARSGTKAQPNPLADNLKYIADDYFKYVNKDEKDSEEFFSSYIVQLQEWAESSYSHPAVIAVYKYLRKGRAMDDLVKSGVLKIDESTGRLVENEKIEGVELKKSFVRFCVNYNDLTRTSKIWRDKSLQESFILYYKNVLEKKNAKTMCYISGKELVATYKHPYAEGTKKIFSANDDKGLTYRGRFIDDRETYAMGYETSQKMHNALKWIIKRQGIKIDTMVITIWEKYLNEVPDIRNSSDDFDDIEDEDDISTMPQFAELLQKMIFGYREKLPNDSKIMILGLDASSQGRLSVSLFSEMNSSMFYHNLELWYSQTALVRYDSRRKKGRVGSTGVYDIVNCAYGTEKLQKKKEKSGLVSSEVEDKDINGNMGKDKSKVVVCNNSKLFLSVLLRLIPCIMEGRNIPDDIVKNLYHKASNPLAYEKHFNHRLVLETACGMIRKKNIEKKKGVVSVAFDPKVTSRDYLYGCLLAIADKAEREAYRAGNEQTEDGRVTNARRYWNKFSERPYQTWKTIEEHLVPYLGKLGAKSVIYEKRIQEIMDKMSAEDFKNNRALEPEYLLGYHQYMSYMYSNKKEENTNGNTTE